MGDIIRGAMFAVVAIIIIAVICMLLGVLYGVCKTFCIKRLEYKRYFSKEGAFEGEEIYLRGIDKSFISSDVQYRCRVARYIYGQIGRVSEQRLG